MLLLSHSEFLIFIIVIRLKIVLVRMRQAQKSQWLHVQTCYTIRSVLHSRLAE